MADKAYITPAVLLWARQTAKMTVEQAALKIKVAPEKILEWEKGASQPTITQAQKLAKGYRRPFALLFLPEIPYDFTPLQDFRRDTAKPLSTATVFIMREIQQKQAWIRDVYAENNEPTVPFVGKYTIHDSPATVAKDILQTLGITPAHYLTGNPLKEWIDHSEMKGIFVSRTSNIHSRLRINSDELQGFSIADVYAPFVFINTDDWKSPQLFTLVHELAHIWINESGISNEIEAGLKQRGNCIQLSCSVMK